LLPRTKFLIEVPLVGAEQVAKKRFFGLGGLAILLAILALTVSLANRTVHARFCNISTVHSASPDAKIQHRDKDHSTWISPIVNLVVRCVIEPLLKPFSGERVVAVLNCDSLYKRPPPVS